MTGEQMPWWQRGVIYQIYPRSFQDSNGDGIGDLRGIIARLDYLSWLGVEAVWLSPFYPSPMVDFGYDVSNYTDVDAIFGDLATFDELIQQAHRYGIKVIIDFVINHSSDEHPWFLDSRSSRDASRRHWYIWADAKPGGTPPNNWVSHFGGQPGSGMQLQDSITCTRLTGGNPISTGAIQRCKQRCSMSCASGWSMKWMASASTPPT
jgi:alpha-glucosidase